MKASSAGRPQGQVSLEGEEYPGTHKFEVNGIATYKNTEWYVDTGSGYVYKETDLSGLLAVDPDYSYTFIAGSGVAIKAIVYNSDWTVREWHIWNVTPPPVTPSSPSPSNGATVSSQPSILDWATANGTSSYDVYLNNGFAGSVSSSQWGLNQSLVPGPHSWYVMIRR